MFTVKKAAEILHVSPALVYGLCAQGRITHERYGLRRGTIRISETALADYQERARVANIAPPLPLASLPALRHVSLSTSATDREGKQVTARGAGNA